jgi:NAD(P)-dependent dehydrogenase (short-subunit alcohol dehydrogenase family)
VSALASKAAVVTGAAKGIGHAIAQTLAAHGARVAVVDRDADASHIGDGIAVQADVSRSDDCEHAIARAMQEFGRLDILVNSAGIQRYGDVVDTPEAEWDEVMGVNLKGAFLMAKHAMPHLIASGQGAVLNVASVQAFAAQRGVVAYSASKGGLVSLTRAIAVDHAPVVRCNAICPGSVDTPMLRWAADKFGEGDPDAAVKKWGEMHPMDRVARPEEVAEAALFLVSPASSFITGASLLVDGGLLSVIGGT